jgi:copper(I)-binding protein
MGHWGKRPGKADRDDDQQARRPAVRAASILVRAIPDGAILARGVPIRRLPMRKLLLSSALFSLGLAYPAIAHHDGEIHKLGDLVVSHAWMRENPGMAHATAVYLTIDNQGSEADRLVGAEVDFADEAVFQAQTMGADGTLEVRDVSGVKIQPDQVLTLKPGVVWIELEGVRRTFRHGEHFDMTLTFEKAGTVEIEVAIEPAGGPEHEDEETS